MKFYHFFIFFTIDFNILYLITGLYTGLSNLIVFIFFCISTITNGNIDIIAVYIHCLLFNSTTSNISAILGITTTPTCKIVPIKNAPIKYLF